MQITMDLERLGEESVCPEIISAKQDLQKSLNCSPHMAQLT